MSVLDQVTDQFKVGYKTTEFWGAKVALLIPAVAATAKLFGYEVDDATLAITMNGLIPEVGYIISRGWVKKSRATAVGNVAGAISYNESNAPQPGAASEGDDMPSPDSTLA